MRIISAERNLEGQAEGPQAVRRTQFPKAVGAKHLTSFNKRATTLVHVGGLALARSTAMWLFHSRETESGFARSPGTYSTGALSECARPIIVEGTAGG